MHLYMAPPCRAVVHVRFLNAVPFVLLFNASLFAFSAGVCGGRLHGIPAVREASWLKRALANELTARVVNSCFVVRVVRRFVHNRLRRGTGLMLEAANQRAFQVRAQVPFHCRVGA